MVKTKIKIRKGDTVMVISGRRSVKGKSGQVIKVIPKENRLVIEGVNIRKKHISEVRAQGRRIQPGIVEFEAPMDMSNVMLVCPKCNEPTRVGIVRDEDDGAMMRFCKKCEAVFK